MSYDKNYVNKLKLLVESLEMAQEPDASWICAIIRALVHEIQSELNAGECEEDREANARLNAIIAECRAAVLGSRKESIERASIHLKALEND
ncbi:MAG: hypothetical protein V4710_17890 [Verrucomicrobiota bacterium]